MHAWSKKVIENAFSDYDLIVFDRSFSDFRVFPGNTPIIRNNILPIIFM